MADEGNKPEVTREEIESELNSLREEYVRLQDHVSNIEAKYVRLQDHLADIEIKYQQALINDSNIYDSNQFLFCLKTVIAALFNKAEYSDIRIQLENDRQCYGHRIVLAVRSEYWGVTDLSECDHLDLSDINYDVAMAMLKWVYTDEINPSVDENFLKNLLQIAARFHLDSLQDRVEKLLINVISDTNCDEFYLMSKQLQCPLLRDFTLEFIKQVQKKTVLENENIPNEQDVNTQESNISNEAIKNKSEEFTGAKDSDETQKVFDCHLCSKKFNSAYSLKRHSATHSGLKPHSCEFCQKMYSDKSSMYKHMKRSHPESIIQINEKKRQKRKMLLAEVGMEEMPDLEVDENICKPNTTRKPYKCFKCSKRFSKRYPLKRHMEIHKGLKPYACQYCDKAYTDPSSMKKHIKQVHLEKNAVKNTSPKRPLIPKLESKVLQCDFCQEKFSHKRALICHRFVHTGEKPHKCEECGRNFRHRESLRVHMRTHTGEKPYQCDECGRFFAEKCQLRQHSRIHSGVMPFECNVCNRPFRHRETLVVHMRLHSDERPYQCDLCGKSFRANGGLKGHMRTHTGEKPFSCEVCGKRFSEKGHMRRHRKIHDKSPSGIIEGMDIDKLDIPVHETVTIQTMNDTSENGVIADEIHEIQNLTENGEEIEYHISENGSLIQMQTYSTSSKEQIVIIQQIPESDTEDS